jgi:hypothetical protein
MQRSLDRFSPKNTKPSRIHRSITTWDWFSPQNSKAGRMQRTLDRFSPKNPRPVGYINHQQQPTTIIFHMINQQVPPENRKWKTSPENCWKMQNFVGASKLAENTQNMPAVPLNKRKTLKTEQKHSLEARRSIVRIFFFLMAAATSSATTEHSDHNHRTWK